MGGEQGALEGWGGFCATPSLALAIAHVLVHLLTHALALRFEQRVSLSAALFYLLSYHRTQEVT